MKRAVNISVAVLVAICTIFGVAATKREQRATWMSAFVSDWPNAKITSENAEFMKNLCQKDLDSLQRSNFTTIYYHVRTMCDAMYDSKYEPWSSYVSPKRGEAPVFDPFAYLIENAHARGIEVYAWLNPYRYVNSVYSEGWGSDGGDKNYENSHPDWLIKWQYEDEGRTRTWTILNPALPEVKQRIVDVVADILDKYDVDGIVFDDYFYQNGLPDSYDASDYNAYKSSGGTLGKADWRRENVNDMVRKVNDCIKAKKPYVRFGIGPAGVACSSGIVAEKYGVDPCPGSDWQYDGIYSDPLAWLSEGSIDFISPQVYWLIGYQAADFAKITPWWYKVSAKFNRHCYISQDLSNSRSQSAPFTEFSDEIDLIRSSVEDDAPGAVYFPWKSLKSLRVRENRRNVYITEYLRRNVFQNKSLTPAVTWLQPENPGTVSSVVRSGRTLSWDGPDNVRFSVYAMPSDVTAANFHREEEYLVGVTYGKTFEIPDVSNMYPGTGVADGDLDKHNYAVAVYDRYGNEYGAVFVGASVAASETPVATYPKGGEMASSAFRFTWTGSSSAYELRVATDKEMKNIVAQKEVTGNYAESSDIFTFAANTTYYWQLRTRGNNSTEAVSAVESFTVDVFRMVSPSDGTVGMELSSEVSWSSAGSNADYVLMVSKSNDFSKDLVYELATKATSVKIPDYLLAGNTQYFFKVEAKSGDASIETDVVAATTKYVEPVAPSFSNPSESGQVIHANEVVAVAPESGVLQTTIMISGSESFSARSSYKGVFDAGVFTTPELQDVKLITKELVDGQTYYSRAQFQYVSESGSTAETAWSPVVQFVYSSEAGVANAVADGGMWFADDAIIASEPATEITVYAADGRVVLSGVADASGKLPVATLPAGVYVAKAANESVKFAK